MTEYIATVTEYGRGRQQVTLTDERVVRCRDCRHHHDRRGDELPSLACTRLGTPFATSPEKFCWWGDYD